MLTLESLNADAAPSRVYNLGCGGEGYTVREVLDTAREVTGRPITARIGVRRPGDPAVLIASSARIQRELGFLPEHQDLAVIIESAWRWMRAHQELITADRPAA